MQNLLRPSYDAFFVIMSFYIASLHYFYQTCLRYESKEIIVDWLFVSALIHIPTIIVLLYPFKRDDREELENTYVKWILLPFQIFVIVSGTFFMHFRYIEKFDLSAFSFCYLLLQYVYTLGIVMLAI